MKTFRLLFLSLPLLFVYSCSSDSSQQQTERNTNQTQEAEFTDFELEHGIGPVTERITLGELDLEKVAKGQAIFNSKCTACHEFERRFVGPPYIDVLERRSPEFVMNFILNPGEMARKHPEGQKMLAEFLTVMPFQNVTKEEARAIVEYFRTRTSE